MIELFKNRSYSIIYIGIFLFAAILRFIDLGSRAVHHDESLHGFFSYATSIGQYYPHNPLTHGMFLFNSLSATFWIFGSNEFLLRLPFAIVGLLIVLFPMIIRKEIGDKSTLLIAGLISISPSLTYFSRFARNDIFMSAIIILLFISIYKYYLSKNNNWLYFLIFIVSLGFTIKETMYLNILGILIFLFLVSIKDLLRVILSEIHISEINHITKLFLILLLIVIPLGAPMFSVFQSSIGVILSTPDSYPGVPPGLPVGNGVFVSIIITFILLGISNFFGLIIDKTVWIRSFSIFLIVFFLMFTTFFINPSGLITGHWQSLGYWLSQHDVARGNQPLYYYFILLFTNEFLVFLIGLPISLFYLFKGTFFEKLLSFNALFSLIAFSIAGEKMPWLVVNLVIPYIFLVSLFLSKIINSINFKLERIVISLVASSVLFYLTIKILFTDYSNNTNYLYFDLIYVIVALLLVLFAISLKKFISLVDLSKSLLIVIFISFTLLTIKTTNKVIFDLSDEPRDMLIYTQSSPALHNLYDEIEESYIKKDKLIVGIDTMDGFAWPWMWYLREHKNVVWINELNIDKHDYDYLLINQKNFEKLSSESLSNYKFKRIIAHRKWFPESIYRNKSTSDFFKIITSSKSRAKISNYIMNRNFETRIGSTNFVLLKSNNFESIE